MRLLNRFFLLMLLLGGLNMGGIGLLGVNGAALLLDTGSLLFRGFYVLVGVSAAAFTVALLQLKITERI